MSPELDEFLVKTYPKIFAGRHDDPRETAMCWGFECGDGWFSLINGLCLRIQRHLDAHPEAPQVVAVQVKEKFGTLRFYVYGGDDYVYSIIEDAQELSSHICEESGWPGEVVDDGGWLRCLAADLTEAQACN